MTTAHTKIFKTNRSQAVRLPRAVALPEDIKEVDIVALGRVRIITPAGQSWDEWFDAPGASDDFMAAREQPEDQGRDTL